MSEFKLGDRVRIKSTVDRNHRNKRGSIVTSSARGTWGVRCDGNGFVDWCWPDDLELLNPVDDLARLGEDEWEA